MKTGSIGVFFSLLQAGLWEKEVRLQPFGEIDLAEVLGLAEEQAVVGLITAGIEHISDVKLAKMDVLEFIGQTVQLEQKNTAMNHFISILVGKMKDAGIYTTLVKGQGIAQCYERPFWRECGDVDLFLDDDNYERAKSLLLPLASSSDSEGIFSKHLGMTIDSWVVELHGSLRVGLPNRVNRILDEIKNDVFVNNNVRLWQNGATEVYLPSIDDDAVYIFVHFYNHFYKGGVGLRQICDWCRLLWTYRNLLDKSLLEQRLHRAGLMSAWKAFGALAVKYLAMPVEALPFYSDATKWKRKAERLCAFVLEVGNFGHNRDFSYYEKYPYIIRKTISLGHRARDLYRHARIFPWDSLRFFPSILINGVRSALRGE